MLLLPQLKTINDSLILLWKHNDCVSSKLLTPSCFSRNSPGFPNILTNHFSTAANGVTSVMIGLKEKIPNCYQLQCVHFTEKQGVSVSRFRPLPQCPGGLPPPASCKTRGSGKVFVEGGPGVWPCSCAARWPVQSGKPRSDSTFPLSPGCRKRCSCPGDKTFKNNTPLKCSTLGKYLNYIIK